MDKILKNLKEKLEAKPPTDERIRLFINQHIELYCQNIPESHLVIKEVNNLPPEYREKVRVKSKQYYQLLLFSIESSFSSSVISQERLEVAAYSLLGMCNWIYRWYDPKGPINYKTLSKEIYNIFTGKFMSSSGG